MTTLRPHLMFQGQMAEALAHWRGAFPDMVVSPRMQEGDRILLADVEICGQVLSCFDSPPAHDFTFTPSVSLFVTCDTVEEVDRIATHLGDGGSALMPLGSYDFSDRFAWITDPFGVSWQIGLAR